MILSQGDSSTKKIRLKSANLKDWIYDSTFTSNIHTVGQIGEIYETNNIFNWFSTINSFVGGMLKK